MRVTQKNFTTGVIAGFGCPLDKDQVIYFDAKTPGFALRVTSSGAKSFIFQSKLKEQTIRLTIGSPDAWTLKDARTQAARLKIMIDQGIDPRIVKAQKAAADQAARREKKAQEVREVVTVGKAWNDYVDATKSLWGALHLHDHERAMQKGGEQRTRSKLLTEPGALASLADVRLVDLTTERLIAWAKAEGKRRPARARNARTLLSTFLNWCNKHSVYGAIIATNPAQNKEIKRYLGKPAVKNDALQREQLPAWFVAVKQIQNPVISAYLQALLLTGARSNELACLRWVDVDLRWRSMTIKDKIESFRIIPLTPYVAHLMSTLPRRNEWVFSSPTAASGHVEEPRIAHDKACAIAGLDLTLHGLRRSFASLCEWIEAPGGIVSQIQGHKPQGVREKHYIRRPLDLLRVWHTKIEEWILGQARIEFTPQQNQGGLRVIESK